MSISKQDIVLNISNNGQGIDAIILASKWYLYSCRCKQMLPNFIGLLNNVRFIYKTEQFIAEKNNRSPSHAKKWAGIMDLFSNAGNSYIDDL